MDSAAARADLLRIASDIATEAGEFALAQRNIGVEVAATKSSETDVVTRTDRAAEELIRRLLHDARPDDGFLGEESAGQSGTSGLTWVVDPIDGTVNYLYDLPAWAVSIAVVEGDPDPATWRTLAGVVISPRLSELFTASAGGGARLGDRTLSVRTGVPLAQALVATGFSYRSTTRLEQVEVLRRIIGEVRDIRRIGSGALDLCSVAAGRVDAYFERELNPWDHAAGALIAREAGASVGGIGGEPEGFAMTIAAEAGLAAQLRALIGES